MEFKSRLLAILLYLNVITEREYSGRVLHDWEIRDDYQRQQEVDDSWSTESFNEAEGNRDSGAEDNTE